MIVVSIYRWILGNKRQSLQTLMDGIVMKEALNVPCEEKRTGNSLLMVLSRYLSWPLCCRPVELNNAIMEMMACAETVSSGEICSCLGLPQIRCFLNVLDNVEIFSLDSTNLWKRRKRHNFERFVVCLQYR